MALLGSDMLTLTNDVLYKALVNTCESILTVFEDSGTVVMSHISLWFHLIKKMKQCMLAPSHIKDHYTI